MLYRLLFAALIIFPCLPAFAAEGWSPTIAPRPTLPDTVIAVDKSRQQVDIILHDPQTRSMWARLSLPCTTGRSSGDKEAEGDLKTPEGVYFIQGVSRGEALNSTMFGDAAYPLNYPNPVDRLQGKTGSGILIHGRNRGVGPRQTLGCVVLENSNLARLAPNLDIQTTPVIIGASTAVRSQPGAGPQPDVAAATWGWATAQEQRSPLFFDFFNPTLFARSSGLPFASYRARITSEFARRPWVDIRISDLRLYEGPDYLVTAFTQHTYPGGESGYRRLYWMQSADTWKIVGEEWVPGSLPGIDYETTMRREIIDRLTACRVAWDDGSVAGLLAAYDRGGVREGAKGRVAIEKSLTAALARKTANPFAARPNIRIGARGAEVTLHGKGRPSRRLIMLPTYFDKWVILDEKML